MKPHILFVDDEAPIRELLSLYFRKNGYDVTTTPRGSDAMELMDKNAYQLAILDVKLNGENGLELLGFFKSNYPKMPVIMFTSLPEDEVVQRALSNGADGVMQKDGSLTELLSEVRRYVPPA